MQISKIFPTTLAVICLLAVSSQAKAGLVTDTFEIKSFSTTNSNTTTVFNGNGFVGLRANSFDSDLLLEVSNGNSTTRTALQVDISSLSGRTITSATLAFYLNFPASTQGQNNANLTVTSFLTNGQLAHVFDLPNSPDNQSLIETVNGPATNEISVTNLLQSRVDSGTNWFGLHLAAFRQDGQTAGLWTNGTQANMSLVVTHVPEPSAITLVTALAGLVAIRRGRRK